MTLLNMLIGVLCQVIEDSAQGEAEAPGDLEEKVEKNRWERNDFFRL